MKYKSYKIADICHLVKGTSPTLKTEPGAYPLVVTAAHRRTASTYQLEGPAVCVPLISSTGHGDAALHRVHYQEGKFALANLLVALLPKDLDSCEAKYLYHLLMAKKEEYFVPLMLGTANVSLKEKDIANVEITLPQPDEQRRIVARIEELAGKIEVARTLREEGIREVEILLSSTISATCADNAIWHTVQDAVAKKKGAVRSGPFGSQLLHEEFVNSGVAAIGSRDVQVDNFELRGGWFVTHEKFEQFKRYQIFPGDLLCTIVGGSIGRFCVVPTDVPLAFSTKHVQALTLDTNAVEPRFASYMLNFHRRCRDSLFSQVEGSAQPSLNAGKILSTEFPIPTMTKQTQIIAYLDDFRAKTNALRALQKETSEELEALMPSILDKAFRGEL